MVTGKVLHPPIVRKHRVKTYDWDAHEMTLSELPQALVTSFLLSNVDLQPASVLARPTQRFHLVEHEAQLRLVELLPLPFLPAVVEHSPHDYTLHGVKWQMKVGGYSAYQDRWKVHLGKQGGVVKGRPSQRQYTVDDFRWLAIQLPVNHDRGRVCDSGPSAGK